MRAKEDGDLKIPRHSRRSPKLKDVGAEPGRKPGTSGIENIENHSTKAERESMGHRSANTN